MPFLARAHLASGRKGEPLVLVDATATREHEAERWRDPVVSPIALADKGMLLLLDGGALPPEVQRLVARAHAEHRTPWDTPVDFTLAVTSRGALAEVLVAGRFEPALAGRLAEAAIASLPRLRDRPEDLRALLSDRLAREGLRARGAPAGIDDAAFARFLEYPFDGEEAEWLRCDRHPYVTTRFVAKSVVRGFRDASAQPAGS